MVFFFHKNNKKPFGKPQKLNLIVAQGHKPAIDIVIIREKNKFISPFFDPPIGI